jgi:small subunit ribosomal protein S1
LLLLKKCIIINTPFLIQRQFLSLLYYVINRTSTARFQSAVAEQTETSTSSEEKSKARGPTRFDRLKQLYKGPRFIATDQEVPFSYEDFAQAVSVTEYAFERNSVVQGVAVEYSGEKGCLVDIGAKASAFLPAQESSLYMADNAGLSDVIPLDTPMNFQIISEEDENGQLIVSVKRIQYKEAWEKVLTLSEADEVVEAQVVAVNRGGAICLIEGLRAFLPGSHLAGQLPDESLIGQVLKLKFLEVNQENGKLVVSNRKAIVEQQMADLSRGDLVEGIVKALKPYGAFVEVGGMSGLLHISQISYDRIDDLEKVLQPGMAVKCMIIDHDKVNGRIALSTKTLEPEPGDMLKNSQMVYDNAEQTAILYHKKMEEQRLEREKAARDIVMGLGDSLDDLDGSSSSDPLKDVSDSLDSLLS